MARIHVFADESGNFTFKNKSGATKYFILTTATFFDDYQTCRELLDLRHQLAFEGEFSGPFHAKNDKYSTRLRVFDVLSRHSFRVDATIIEKRKSQPQLRTSNARFYRYAWYFHMKHVAPQLCAPNDELLVVASTITTKGKARSFHNGVVDVMKQVGPAVPYETTHWLGSTHPALQAADYCSWAIQRKWEQGDTSWMPHIEANVRSEFDIFRPGTAMYY